MSPPSDFSSRYTVHRITQKFDWSQAACLSDFSFPWDATPPPKTEFRALWDDEYIHFRFDCVDEDLVLGEGETIKERVLASDRVEIFLTPDLSLSPYYAFEMSPRGETLAYSAKFYREYDWDWSCPELCLTAEIQDHQYHVQGSLPLSTLRALNILRPDSREFYAGVYRAEFSHKPDGSIHTGWMPWVNPGTEKPDFHVPASFGMFELVG